MLNEEDRDSINEEIAPGENIEISETEVESHETKEELKYPQENDSEQTIVIILDDLDENKNNPRIQAMFRRSRHNNIFILIISQDYYEHQRDS